MTILVPREVPHPSDEALAECASTFEKHRIFLLATQPFYGTLLMNLKYCGFHASVPTAAVSPDGSVYMNPAWILSLTAEQQRGLLLHETLHVALDAFGRQGPRAPGLWNKAHDFAINLLIDDIPGGRISLPPGGLLNQQFRGMSAEEIYDLLVQDSDRDDDGGAYHDFPVPGDGRGDGGTSHGGGSSMPDDLRADLATSELGKKAERGDQSAVNELRQKWKEIVAIARQTAKMQGKMPAGLDQQIEKYLNPTVPWFEVLARFVGDALGPQMSTFSRPSRRQSAIGRAAILPGRNRRTGADITILWDTSGSMNGEADAIFAEVCGICDDMGISARLIVCDADVHWDGLIECADDALDHLSGGGGSDFIPAFDRIDEEARRTVVVAFTDGYISVPSTQSPFVNGAIWCLTKGGKRPAPWGEVISLEDS